MVIMANQATDIVVDERTSKSINEVQLSRLRQHYEANLSQLMLLANVTPGIANGPTPDDKLEHRVLAHQKRIIEEAHDIRAETLSEIQLKVRLLKEELSVEEDDPSPAERLLLSIMEDIDSLAVDNGY